MSPQHNSGKICDAFGRALHGIKVRHEPHLEFKRRVPGALGLIRTGDTIRYANLILESA